MIDESVDGQIPEQIFTSDVSALWYKPLDRFRSPKSTSFYSFQKANVNATARDHVLLSLYVSLLTDAMNEMVYPAYIAGVGFRFYNHGRGLTLKLTGFDDKQALLLDNVLGVIRRPAFTQAQFERIKQEAEQRYANAEKRPPAYKLLDYWRSDMNQEAVG